MDAPCPYGSLLRDRYRVEESLHRGRYDIVYRAMDLHRNLPVAVKEMQDGIFSDPLQQKKALQQFEDEYRTLSRLSHPGLPQVYDLFSDAGRHFLVLEYIEGQSLEQLLTHGPELPSQDHALHWLWQLLDVLAFLHSQAPPIIYRDLRPATVLITPLGQVKLTDFGIAKMMDPARGQRTLFRAVGSPEFAPPESFGMSRSDARTDIYALGATLYFVLTGTPPPPAADRIIRQARLQDTRQVNPSVSTTLALTLEQMMSVRAADRPASIEKVQEMLLPLRYRPDSQPLVGLPTPPEKPVGEPRMPVPSAPPERKPAAQKDQPTVPQAVVIPAAPPSPMPVTVALWILWTVAVFAAGWSAGH